MPANAVLKNISLLSDVPLSLPPAWADRARVRQILTNLIDNGIKFTPNNGTVTVRVRSALRTRIFSTYPW